MENTTIKRPVNPLAGLKVVTDSPVGSEGCGGVTGGFGVIGGVGVMILGGVVPLAISLGLGSVPLG